MMLAKRLIDRLVTEDVAIQCTKSPECHRKDGHDGDCKSLGVVLVQKAERWVRGKLGAR
jgi:hypothetical protein